MASLNISIFCKAWLIMAQYILYQAHIVQSLVLYQKGPYTLWQGESYVLGKISGFIT